MGKARGVGKRRRKAGSFHYSTSKKLKRVRQRELRKCGPIANQVVRDVWDTKKSLKVNMARMGLAHDPNKALRGPRFQDQYRNPAKAKTDGDPNNMVLELHRRLAKKKERLEKRRKTAKIGDSAFEIEMMPTDNNNNGEVESSVASKLEEIAAKPRVKNFKFGPEQIKFCAYMIEKYGEDYESMARDKINYYQESAGQIRAKIRKFLSIDSNRAVYERAKQMAEAEA